MSERRQPGVIGSLPSTRPHRRSGKRSPAAEAGAPEAAADAAQSTAPEAAADAAQSTAPEAAADAAQSAAPEAKSTPPAPRRVAAPKPARARPAAARTHASERPRARAPEASSPAAEPEPAPGALQTAVEAAVELTEIGLRVSAQALRTALSRLPRP